VVAQLVEPR